MTATINLNPNQVSYDEHEQAQRNLPIDQEQLGWARGDATRQRQAAQDARNQASHLEREAQALETQANAFAKEAREQESLRDYWRRERNVSQADHAQRAHTQATINHSEALLDAHLNRTQARQLAAEAADHDKQAQEAEQRAANIQPAVDQATQTINQFQAQRQAGGSAQLAPPPPDDGDQLPAPRQSLEELGAAYDQELRGRQGR